MVKFIDRKQNSIEWRLSEALGRGNAELFFNGNQTSVCKAGKILEMVVVTVVQQGECAQCH